MRKHSFLVGLAGLGALAAAHPGASLQDDQVAAESIKLTHRAHEKWDFVLPSEKWKPVGDQLVLPGGLQFATQKVGPLKLKVDTNGDGRVDAEVKGQDGFVTLRTKNEDGELVKYSVRIRNSAAGKWDWSTGSSMTGKVAGTVIHVFDQNGNGRYDDYGVDAMAVGKDKYASLLSKVSLIKGDLFNFEIDEDGTLAESRPYSGPTGTLNAVAGFKSKGKLTGAVFKNGELAFQVAGERKGVTVPVGDYTFVSGRVAKGQAHASLRRGRMGRISVTENQETKLVWGADVSGEFNFKQQGDKVTVQPNFAYYGAGGEEYYDFAPKGKGPKIVLKDTKRGKVLKEGRFPES